MSKKYFIITVDTEGDDLWSWRPGKEITTENVVYLPRFQKLCNEYGFKPVWLTNYEMIMDPRYVEFVSNVVESNMGEVGMHLHAWNNPPIVDLPVAQDGAPYLIEYPYGTMDEKIGFLTELIAEKVGVRPVSHRAGRWAVNQDYYELLAKHGYQVDCSVTPHVNWKTSMGQTEGAQGIDYTDSGESPFFVTCDNKKQILEVPVTIRNTRRFIRPDKFSMHTMASTMYHCLKPRTIWMRPMKSNLNSMLTLSDIVLSEQTDYIEFMIHSSELMPGGSPNYKSQDDIETLYSDMEHLFKNIAKDYTGIKLNDYAYTRNK